MYGDVLPFEEPDSWAKSDLIVGPVSTGEGADFIARHHYAGGGGERCTCVGLYRGVRLVGVAAFGGPASGDAAASVFGKEHCDKVMDLQRFVLVDEAPKNTESWFLVRALRAYKALRPHTWAVTSFADGSEGHLGTIYQATNAIYSGESRPRVQFIDRGGRLRSDRGPRAGAPGLSIADGRARGWEPVRRLGKHRYLFLTPTDRKHRRELLQLLKWDPQPYPKANRLDGAA